MKFFYISLGSFCHPKILLRETNRPVLESLPFDFHSSPCTYSIYHILEKLYYQKTYAPQFKEILYTHQFNTIHKEELTVQDNDDVYFLHFFDVNDLCTIPSSYPASMDHISTEKIQKVQQKFERRFQRLYQIMNDPENVLIFLRIENYENPAWKSDIEQLCKIVDLYSNKNKFIIYSQINIDNHLDFHNSHVLNYDYKIPVMFLKKKFTEDISSHQKNDFLQVLTSFEQIIDNCLTLKFQEKILLFYYNSSEQKLYMLNDLNYWYRILEMKDGLLKCIHEAENNLLIFNEKENYYDHSSTFSISS